jgi:ring-1,2-phenylacetyl-CoA epoxidase subunit PaaD
VNSDAQDINLSMNSITDSTMSLADAAALAADTLVVRAWAALESVPDPEIPVVSIRELGILREVRPAAGGGLEVLITPTYSGCPAMSQIGEDIEQALQAAGIVDYRLITVLSPAWTTDWITPQARAKLLEYGIAPPGGAMPAGEQIVRFGMRSQAATPACPQCHSRHTERLSEFGSTACKALYRGLDCREPFDYFKPS